jgi:predicted RNase H-like nuclease (RuvC/YqgF family)
MSTKDTLKEKISLLKKKADKYDNLLKKYNQLKDNADSALKIQNHHFLNLYQNKDQEYENALDKISDFTGTIDDLKGELIKNAKTIKDLNDEINSLEEYVLNRQNVINELSTQNKYFKDTFDNISSIWTRHIRDRDDEIAFLKELILTKENEISNLKQQANFPFYQNFRQLNNENITSETQCLEPSNLDCSSLTGENNEHVQILINSLNNLITDSIDETQCVEWHLLDDNDYSNEQK